MEQNKNISELDDHHYIVEIVKLFTQWRKFIIVTVFSSAVISTIVAFVLPPQFKSTASVLPAEQADLFGSIEGISSIAKSFTSGKGLSALKADDELDRYTAILKSGRVLSKVIQEFDLVNVYEITSYPMEKTTKKLLSNVDFTIENEGYLSISVYDEDAQRAADIANFFVDELNRANSELQAKNATANRIFVEERYKKNLLDLKASEDSMKLFQKKYGIIAMPEQTEATIKAGAALAAELTLKEVQLEVELRVLSKDHSSVRSLQIEIEELKKKLHSMNRSTQSTVNADDMHLLVPFASIPDLGADYMRRFRDIEIQYKILQFLTPMYEQSKVEEQRQTPSVIVLDRATPAERKSKPKRSLIMLGGTLIGMLTAVTYVGLRSRWMRERESNSNIFKAISELFDAMRSDVKKRSM